MKASPTPDSMTSLTGTPNSLAKLPRMAKMVNPANREVNVSTMEMMTASL